MKPNWKTTAVLTLMALVFTMGLTFTALEIPRLADSFIQKKIGTPQLATGQNVETEQKTQLYLRFYHLRTLGYMALAVILLLIIAGFVTNRSGMASAGALLLFLPVFGHFAATMFFLGGLAMLRILWLPFLDLSFDITRLGEVVLIPYRLILGLFSALGLNIREFLPHIITGIGFFIFMLGSLAWFYARFRKQKVADFWIYKISRHPQYLGWIIWSYGILFLPGVNMRRSYEISNTLAWLLSTMVIIGVAFFEELRMHGMAGDGYRVYREKTPFLFPLPRWLTRFIKTPLALFFRKKHFERKREILVFLGFYTGLLMLLSGFYSGLIPVGRQQNVLSPEKMNRIVERITHTDNRITIREELGKLAGSGQPALGSLLSLTRAENPIVRWYTVDVLGDYRNPEVIRTLIGLLNDPDSWVRKAAAGSLGKLRATDAVIPLMEALGDSERNMGVASANALGQIGDPRALPALMTTLYQAPGHVAGAAAEALGVMGDKTAISALIYCLEARTDCPFNPVGQALLALGSPRALDAFASGLSDKNWWERIASLRNLARIESPDALKCILDSLHDPEVKVRRTAVWILKSMGKREALEPLKQMVDDPDFEVRLYAREAVRILEGNR